MIGKLNKVKQIILEADAYESNSLKNIGDKEDKKEKKSEDKEVDLEKELTSTGDKKEDYSKQVIDVINKMIDGNATIEDLEKAIKSKKIKKDEK